MRQYGSYQGENLYIAGPACFYHDGYALWHGLGNIAEYYGFNVVMPTKRSLDLTHEDLRKNADTIFQNCAAAMRETTALIADLEAFRGTEPDGGTLFEIGMAYAKNASITGYTRDKRPLLQKVGAALTTEGGVTHGNGKRLPYGELPFCPSLLGSTRIIEGGFEEALKLTMLDIDWDKRETVRLKAAADPVQIRQGSVFVFSADAFYRGDTAWYEAQKAALQKAGLTVQTPFGLAANEAEELPDAPYERAMRLFARWQNSVRECEMLLVDLNDMNGYEPSGDASVLAGMAWQLGRKCMGFMKDTRCMRDRIPHLGENEGYKDALGNDVENFNYPINLMFSSSMPILQGEPTAFAQKAKSVFSL